MPFHPKTNKISKLKIKKIDDRPNAYRRGYDSSWRLVRHQHLQNNPICLDCLKEGRYVAATDVHHIKKLAEHPELRDVSENLMSLCHRCHSIRTGKGE
jgi:5-methylcytosine-specific restriction protein A